jgi:hypothetical protein
MTTALPMTALLFALSASPNPDPAPPAGPALGATSDDASRQEVFTPSVEPALEALARLGAEAGAQASTSVQVAADTRLGALYAGPSRPLGAGRPAAPARIDEAGAAFAHFDASALRRVVGSSCGPR